ncbi:MAG: UDP-N-acetylglucosamine 1-carboxyvinyltransferase [Candidatus Portnoybacteria bacterium]|nr:UDP-N-acetylglucosamine 1-carboxyvinyltransferase [Candidatus Portnoybacteria bacterium]
MEKRNNEKFVIHGGKPLSGEIEVLGSKNAATPLLAASILFEKAVTLDNIPLVEDVFRMIDILKSIGAKVSWLSKRKITIDTSKLTPKSIDQELVEMLRSSILFIGPLLARFGTCTIAHPGGCIIGARPLDTHFQAFRDLGVEIKIEKGRKSNVYTFDARSLHGGEVILEEFSVTATENVLLLSSVLKEQVKVKLAACEPHVQDLIRFLQAGGVTIQKEGDHTLLVKGKKRLTPIVHRVVPDYIEAGTFLVLSHLYGGQINVRNVPYEFLDAVVKKIRDVQEGKPINIQTLPYPGFPTDLQAPFGVLATQLKGISRIHDPLYENRFGYLEELKRMGAKAKLLNPHEAIIEGPTPLKGARIESFDLRAGITLILAGLIAKEKTVIHNAYQVDRGYERIDERLRMLGGHIERISS